MWCGCDCAVRKFDFTYADIAGASGKKVNHVRVDATRGKLDPEDIGSVSAYVVNGILEGRNADRKAAEKES